MTTPWRWFRTVGGRPPLYTIRAARPTGRSVAFEQPVPAGVAVGALELGEVAEVDGVLEGARVLVAGGAVRAREVAEVDGVPELAVLERDGPAALGLVE